MTGGAGRALRRARRGDARIVVVIQAGCSEGKKSRRLGASSGPLTRGRQPSERGGCCVAAALARKQDPGAERSAPPTCPDAVPDVLGETVDEDAGQKREALPVCR